MTREMTIDLRHVTRIEGHANIVVNVTDGTVSRCEWQVVEAPRFFEAMVRGRHYTEVARVVSRICGICSIAHTLAAIKATEAALGIAVTPQADRLRRILKHAENLDSHVLHALFLAAPDLLGEPSIFPLVTTRPEVVQLVLRLKRFAHEWGSLIGGRTTHPTRPVPGGFAEWPGRDELIQLRARLEREALPDVRAALEIFTTLMPRLPVFERPTEYVSLHAPGRYALHEGDELRCRLPDGSSTLVPVEHYRQVANEHVVPQSTAKYTRHRLSSYVVGALARFNNHHAQLHPEAKQAAQRLGLVPPLTNPYLNSAVQVVEMVHSVQDSIDQIDALLEGGLGSPEPGRPTRSGSGTAAVEAPRGLLVHHFEYDEDQRCLSGDCVIPTNQNHGNIQDDMEKLVPQLLAAGRSEKEIAHALEMLARAYDPCVSCSTHYLQVRFVR